MNEKNLISVQYLSVALSCLFSPRCVWASLAPKRKIMSFAVVHFVDILKNTLYMTRFMKVYSVLEWEKCLLLYMLRIPHGTVVGEM